MIVKRCVATNANGTHCKRCANSTRLYKKIKVDVCAIHKRASTLNVHRTVPITFEIDDVDCFLSVQDTKNHNVHYDAAPCVVKKQEQCLKKKHLERTTRNELGTEQRLSVQKMLTATIANKASGLYEFLAGTFINGMYDVMKVFPYATMLLKGSTSTRLALTPIINNRHLSETLFGKEGAKELSAVFPLMFPPSDFDTMIFIARDHITTESVCAINEMLLWKFTSIISNLPPRIVSLIYKMKQMAADQSDMTNINVVPITDTSWYADNNRPKHELYVQHLLGENVAIKTSGSHFYIKCNPGHKKISSIHFGNGELEPVVKQSDDAIYFRNLCLLCIENVNLVDEKGDILCVAKSVSEVPNDGIEIKATLKLPIGTRVFLENDQVFLGTVSMSTKRATVLDSHFIPRRHLIARTKYTQKESMPIIVTLEPLIDIQATKSAFSLLRVVFPFSIGMDGQWRSTKAELLDVAIQFAEDHRFELTRQKFSPKNIDKFSFFMCITGGNCPRVVNATYQIADISKMLKLGVAKARKSSGRLALLEFMKDSLSKLSPQLIAQDVLGVDSLHPQKRMSDAIASATMQSEAQVETRENLLNLFRFFSL